MATTNSVLTVDTIAALLALPSTIWTDAPAIQVLGYNAAGDGGGGLFQWNATSGATVDNGVIFKPNGYGGTGRIIRDLQGAPLNILHFGADKTGAADSYSAFTSWVNSTWPVLAVPSGTYSTSGAWLVPNDRTLNGAGSLSTNLQKYGNPALVYLLGNVLQTTTVSFNANISGFNLVGDALMDCGAKLSGLTQSEWKDIVATGFTGASSWGVRFTGTPVNGGVGHALGNKNVLRNIYAIGCTNGLWTGKDSGDSTGVGSTCCNENKYYSCGALNYTGTGIFHGSSQGSVYYDPIASGPNINTIAYQCSGQLTTFINPVADCSVAGSLNPGVYNAYGFPVGRGAAGNNTKGFYFVNDAVQGAPTGSQVFNQVGDGCYDRITFDNTATAVTVQVVGPGSPSGWNYILNPRFINHGWIEADATHRTKWTASTAGLTWNIDVDATVASGAIAAIWQFQGTERFRMSQTIGGNAYFFGGKTNTSVDVVGLFLNATVGAAALCANGAAQLTLANNAVGGGASVLFRTNGTQVGSIATTGSATAYNTSSDRRLKKNIRKPKDIAKKFDKIRVVEYQFRKTNEYGLGVIADELEELFPHIVTGKKGAVDKKGRIDPQSVDYSKLVAPLIVIVQELRARVAELEARE